MLVAVDGYLYLGLLIIEFGSVMIRRYWYWVLLLGGVLACGEEREAEVMLWSSKCGGVADSSQVASSWDSLCYCVQEGADEYLPAVAVGSGDTLSAYQLGQGAKAYAAGKLRVADSLWQEAWARLDTTGLVYPDLLARVLAKRGNGRLYKLKDYESAQNLLYKEMELRNLMGDSSSHDYALNQFKLAVTHRNMGSLIFGKAHAMIAYRLSKNSSLETSTLYELAAQYLHDNEHEQAQMYYLKMLERLPETPTSTKEKMMVVEACMNAFALNRISLAKDLQSKIFLFDDWIKEYGIQRILRGQFISNRLADMKELLDTYPTDKFPLIRMKYFEVQGDWPQAAIYSQRVYQMMSDEEVGDAAQNFNEDSNFLSSYANIQSKAGSMEAANSIFKILISQNGVLEDLVSLEDKHHYLDFMHGVHQDYLDLLYLKGEKLAFVKVLQKAKNNVMRLFANNSSIAKHQAQIRKEISGKPLSDLGNNVLYRIISNRKVAASTSSRTAMPKKTLQTPHINYFEGDSTIYYYAVSSEDTIIQKIASSSIDSLLPKDWVMNQNSFFVIPDGSILRIDFENLELHTGEKLKEVSKISYAFDHLVSDPKKTMDGILAMSFSSKSTLLNDRSPFAELPGTISEIKNLENLGAKVFYGLDATFDNYKKEFSNYGTIHLALHGIADSLYIDSPFLVFRNPRSSSTVDSVFMYDILSLDHTGKDIVLSACSTGAGKHISSEGVYSIARAFKMTGANKLSISFQEIEDNTSSSLRTFH